MVDQQFRRVRLEFTERFVMDVQLVMFTEKGERRDFEVKREAVIIGRSGDCHFQIPLAEVSRRHCKLVWKNEKLFVKDMGSSNGTFLNNKRVLQSEVDAGDQLRVGPVVFTVVINGAPTDIKPVRTIVSGMKEAVKESGESGDGIERLLDSSIAPADAGGAAQTEALADESAAGVDGGPDLDALTEEEEGSDSESPLAELEELAKQRKK